MKKFLIQVVLLMVVIGIGIAFFIPGSTSTISLPFLPQPTKTNELQINDAVFKVEVADTPEKRSKGLGGKESLSDNEGMLFIFDKADRHTFWMKGLKFSLDFVWIKGDMVVDILENVPQPAQGQTDASLPIYTSKTEADKVLELKAGSVKKFNIKVGDSIKNKS